MKLLWDNRPDYTNTHVKDAMDNKKVLADAWEGMFGSIEYELVMKKDTSPRDCC